MLEYFQGILFLTTNRVSVFDPAFASRIHVGLRYGMLDLKARKKVWGMFLRRVRALEEGRGGDGEKVKEEEKGKGDGDRVGEGEKGKVVEEGEKKKGKGRKGEGEGEAEKGNGKGVDESVFGEAEMGKLAAFELNGREIKNAVRTAQSVALVKKETLGMKHLLQVLVVGNVFARDLQGPGHEEAMKFYM